MYASPLPPSIRRAGSSMEATNRGVTPKSFKYNGQVASVLLPSLVVLVGYGGPVVAGVLIVCA